MEKQALVKRGYDKLASEYESQRHQNQYPNKKLLDRFVKTLGKAGRILDLGCGAGIPVAKYLIEKGNRVTGIDISENMLKLAKTNVPKANFRKMDMIKMRFKEKFDGAVSFYAIIHVPRKKHEIIYKKLHRMLKIGGVILIASGTNDSEYYGEFMGEKMFWSHYAPEQTIEIIEDSGFKIIWSKVLKLGGEKQFWVLAKNEK